MRKLFQKLLLLAMSAIGTVALGADFVPQVTSCVDSQVPYLTTYTTLQLVTFQEVAPPIYSFELSVTLHKKDPLTLKPLHSGLIDLWSKKVVGTKPWESKSYFDLGGGGYIEIFNGFSTSELHYRLPGWKNKVVANDCAFPEPGITVFSGVAEQ